MTSDRTGELGPRGGAPEHERTLRAWLERLRTRWRLLTGLGVAARVASGLAAIALSAWLADVIAQPRGLALVGLYGLAVIISLVVIAFLVRPLRRTPTDRQLARMAEEQDGRLDDLVVTATERLGAERSGPFDGLVVASAAEKVRELEPDRIIGRERMSRALRWTVAALLVFGMSAVIGWDPAYRALQTARLYIAPPEIALAVNPGDARVVRGSPLRISARFEGLPAGARPEVPLVHVVQDGQATELPMRREGDAYVADWPRVDHAMRYRVSSGSLSSAEFQVTALDAAHVRRIDLEYAFPSFTNLPPRQEVDAGDIFGPKGTQVTVRVHTDKPVTRGELALRDGEPLPLARGEKDTELVATLTLDRDSAYRIGVEDIDGLKSPPGTEYFIRILDDRPPDVRIVRPAGDRQVTRLEEIVIEAQADDDHGIGALELVYAVKGGKERVVPLHRAPKDAAAGTASRNVTGAHTLYVEELPVEPGDFITYYARARDIGRGKRPTEARSDIFFLEVRPFTEEFFAAQSQAMMAGGGGAAADLLESQKEIIVATWKLQRRAIAGQSAEDVRAVARAQGEVKKRAEQLSAMMARAFTPRRRRGAEPQPAPASGGEHPLQRATAAMGRAEEALNGLKPADAVPHEMAAYNELLKLQAENTRRQVARQRGSGGGGRTGNQDLSALFDEELLRQQETNYENRNAANRGGQNQQDDTLEKLKELARRQDEIAQRQRDLARARAALPQEEVKRQLERLTREQEELRRQTEQLSQQMARNQPGGQPGQPGQQSSRSQSGQSGSSQLREAAEQMARAAREMSEADLDEARQRAEQSVERLRELERRLSGEAVPDEGRRAFGELQLESQQVAEAQQRLANELRRLEEEARRQGAQRQGQRGGRNGSRGNAEGAAAAARTDAMRKLAAEQQRLAERMEALEKRLGGVTGERGGEDAATAAAAAREEIARAQLAEAMRQAASRLRGGDREAGEAAAEAGQRNGREQGRPEGQQSGAAGSGTAPAEQLETLARAAGRVAERLGAPTGGSEETKKLADQLAQLRSLRERMSQIEGRLRDAVQRQQAEAQGQQQGEQQGRENAQGARGRQGQSGRQGNPSQGQDGSQNQGQGQGGGNAGGSSEVERLRAEYDEALRQTRQLMEGMSRDGGNQLGAMATPEGHEFSRSAPGTEAFKQDFAKWESLSKNVNHALEEMEASLAQRLSEQAAKDRVNAGGDERAPSQYSDSVSRYYRSLAKRP
ncbi:MAG TPA: hypothetical protein VIL35_05910 [Vicinamibacterales bacterium]